MSLPEILKFCEKRPGATEEALLDAERAMGRALPDDYKAVLKESNGLEGFLVEGVYIALWPVSDLISLNEAYAVSEFLPGVTLLGTDGGDTGYGFRRDGEQHEYLAVPLIGMGRNAITRHGGCFAEMLRALVVDPASS